MSKTELSKAELSREEQEWRRIRAWDLWQQGWKQKKIANALGVTKGAVSQWIKRGREEGVQGLQRSIAKGATPRLCASDRGKLPALLALGAEAFGFEGDAWTSGRVGQVIKRCFGVGYHPDHCGRLLRQMGWSQQKPVERATQRDEEAIQDWLEQQWPALKKSRARKADHHFCRRSGFFLASDGRADLRTTGPNSGITSQADP